PACPDLPSALTSSAIAVNTATVSWTAAASGTDYDVHYSTTNTAPGATPAPLLDVNGAVTTGLSSLAGNTTYYYWVRTDCGSGDVSGWVGPSTFTTLAACPITNATYCYENSTTEWVNVYVSTPGDYLDITFNSGTVEDTYDELLVYDGADGAGTQLYSGYGASGDVSGLTYQSTTGVISFAVQGDVSNSCGSSQQTQIDYSVVCSAPPACPDPTALSATVTSITTADVSWTGAGTFIVEYGAPGFTPGTGATAGTGGTIASSAATSPYALSSLTGNTTYEIYVRQVCAGPTYSGNAGAVSIYTGYCIPSSTSTASYVNDFQTTGGSTNISNASGAYSATGYGDFTGQSVSQYAGASVSFTAAFTGTTVGFNIWVDWNNDLNFDASEKMYASGGYVGSASGSFSVPGGQALGDYRMRIRCDYNDTDPDPCAARPRAEAEDYTFTVVATPPCPDLPSALTSSAVSNNTATVSWTAAASGTDYDVYYSTTNTTPGATPSPLIDVAGAVTTGLSSLTQNTTYYYWVRTDCGSGDVSTWVGPESFTTACDPVTAFVEDFEGTTGTVFPDCWNQVGATGTANPQDNAGINGARNLYMYNGATVAMRPVSNAGANTHWLRFMQRGNFSSGQQVNVGYLTDPNDASSFVAVTNFTTTSTTASELTIDLGSAPGANQILAFQADGTFGSSFLIDDVNWEQKPPCPDAPSALVSSAVTTNSATVGWTAAATGTDYDVYVSQTNTTPGASPTVIDVTGATSTGLSSLTDNTTYYYWVRTDCGSGDV
ncbi:MAG: fibronectin type III domain-containing protein, partial [Flavobacteriales bacterium]